MANNIAQLKDYNDNNIFPIAGGMVADSVTTQMLQDGSVTSDKIDWATIITASHAALIFSNVSIASDGGTSTGVAQFDVPADSIAMVSGYISYPSNSTGFRDAIIRIGSANIVSARIPAVSGGETRVAVSAILTPSTDNTVSLRAIQNSGSTLSVSGRLTYAIIKTSS